MRRPAGRDDRPVPLCGASAPSLRALGDRLWRAFRGALVGRRTTAVVSTKRAGEQLTAFADQAVPLVLDGPPSLMAKLVRVELGELTADGMQARVIDQSSVQM